MAKPIKEDDIFFVGIRDPVEVRRNLLESTRDVVQTLQRFERFKQVRDEKQQEVAGLREQVKEINRLVNKLKSSLPKTKLRIKLHEEAAVAEKKRKELEEKKAAGKKKEEKQIVKKEEQLPAKRELTEIEKLERELGEIEGRLSNLS